MEEDRGGGRYEYLLVEDKEEIEKQERKSEENIKNNEGKEREIILENR